MNHVSLPFATAWSGSASASAQQDDSAQVNDAPLNMSAGSPRSASRLRRKRRSKKKRNSGLAKKLVFVTHLLKTLDLVVFAELSALYYMECSLFRLVFRLAAQYMYLSPKDESFPIQISPTITHVLLLLIPNIICILSHLVEPLPVGPDFHRGYQHGGLIIDFVGQKPPTYRLYYVLFDVVILALQCLMLSIHAEREMLRVMLKKFRPMFPAAEDSVAPRSPDDLDAEERALPRSPTAVMRDEVEYTELQPLSRSASGTEAGEEAEDTAGLLPRASPGVAPRTPMSDIMASGNALIGEYHVFNSLTSATLGLEQTAAHSLQALGYGATLAALRARPRRSSPRSHSPPSS